MRAKCIPNSHTGQDSHVGQKYFREIALLINKPQQLQSIILCNIEQSFVRDCSLAQPGKSELSIGKTIKISMILVIFPDYFAFKKKIKSVF